MSVPLNPLMRSLLATTIVSWQRSVFDLIQDRKGSSRQEGRLQFYIKYNRQDRAKYPYERARHEHSTGHNETYLALNLILRSAATDTDIFAERQKT